MVLDQTLNPQIHRLKITSQISRNHHKFLIVKMNFSDFFALLKPKPPQNYLRMNMEVEFTQKSKLLTTPIQVTKGLESILKEEVDKGGDDGPP